MSDKFEMGNGGTKTKYHREQGNITIFAEVISRTRELGDIFKGYKPTRSFPRSWTFQPKSWHLCLPL